MGTIIPGPDFAFKHFVIGKQNKQEIKGGGETRLKVPSSACIANSI